ncbi:hypothetical protein C8F04DRAFT_1317151 [Mycena alexandri]|uniref:BTB domain-containing protein n=1 Tax=Mycena alexandri TaxID=1745969 RepID=A0AAD6S4W1_9AGAR|nr:hypothetical protein C8F04DRAFT_1317151 [Mycena alexandri]
MNPNPTPDDTYYLETITFQVEDRLFKVPRYHFERNSEIHATALTLPAGSHTVEGTSDQNPVKLEGIGYGDFRALLKVLYPLRNPMESMPKEEWISVLKLSTMWCLLETRALAIERLTVHVQNTVQGIILGREYHVEDWVRSGYETLAQRGLSLNDAEVIGWETATKIYAIREELLVTEMGYRRQASNLRGADIKAAFLDELQQVASDVYSRTPHLPERTA